ncbi:hypothetical protein DACRYDRAFT_23591 [Dacryopinax primogenitus]|uniref:Eukaryotic mitochondrial regulator protein-domain-containing protein n=1 Tax=Dacryopinax primogenitus (strain DJM 731) TaxID=1858805 RepID=M5FWL8_DACPD|nr:uncharacterized protein DACRYDRAFT_23591 [Dacryopinax primogenitus]EJU00080.1 hypothetical protein DACRYDRAFT_23591 [Dacryopinax primogenitus]
MPPSVLPQLLHVRIRPQHVAYVRRIPQGVASFSRGFSASLRSLAEEEDDSTDLSESPQDPEAEAAQLAESESADSDAPAQTRASSAKETYKQWLRGTGERWRLPPEQGTNYLGIALTTDAPNYGCIFPSNPSFRPPMPLSNEDRNTIYWAYKESPDPQTVRTLSQKYAISIDRVNAVIKLKQHQEIVPQNQLQHALREGMERFMGIHSRLVPEDKLSFQAHNEGPRRKELYTVDEEEKRARDRMVPEQGARRIIWEMVAEGDRPIIARELEEQAERQQQQLAKSRRKQEDLPTVHVPPAKPGRPSWAFVDVGDKFKDSRSREVQGRALKWRGVVNRQRRATGMRMI